MVTLTLTAIGTLNLVFSTQKNTGLIPATLGLIIGGGVTLLSARLIDIIDPPFALFMAVLGFVIMSLSGSIILKGEWKN